MIPLHPKKAAPVNDRILPKLIKFSANDLARPLFEATKDFPLGAKAATVSVFRKHYKTSMIYWRNVEGIYIIHICRFYSYGLN